MASQAPPQHLPLDALTILATRLVALPIFRRPDPMSSEGEVVRRFCPQLNVVRAIQPPPGLSDFLSRRLAAAEAHASTLSAPEQAALTPKLNALRTSVATLACVTCAGKAGHLCNGVNERRDDEQIDSKGLCLGLIRDLHRQVLESVQAALDRWVYGEGNAREIPPHRWGTDWTGRSQYQLPTSEWKAGATTEFQDDDGGPLAEIRLLLAVEEFDWDSLLVIVWLFTHELLCHVCQEPPASGEPRVPCRPFCPFFEGWMDEAAHGVFEASFVCGWLNSGSSPFVRSHRQEIVQAANDYRRDRYGTGPGGNRRIVVAQWNLGVEAARTVRQFLEVTSPHGDETIRRRVALAQLLALSFRIQATTASPRRLGPHRECPVCGFVHAAERGAEGRPGAPFRSSNVSDNE